MSFGVAGQERTLCSASEWPLCFSVFYFFPPRLMQRWDGNGNAGSLWLTTSVGPNRPPPPPLPLSVATSRPIQLFSWRVHPARLRLSCPLLRFLPPELTTSGRSVGQPPCLGLRIQPVRPDTEAAVVKGICRWESLAPFRTIGGF